MLTRCHNCFEEYDPALGVCPHCGFVPGTPAEEAIHMDPGSLLRDRYIIGRVLGFGGFGVTYLAWDAKLEQKVAIKEYLPGEFSTRMPGQSRISVFSGDKAEQFADGMHKFVEEARRLARFQNEPGIVTVFDSFEENNTAYIVMEYLDGETLTERLKRDGKIQEDEAVAMLLPLMESLEKVHAEGILHRDIAPDNIFLTKDGQVKLIDFGAARYATTSHSRSLTVIIKPGYSPEEQYRSRGDQGPHTDVYALGATLYKMITGVTPPDAMERRAKYEGQNKDILVPPQKNAKGLSLARRNAILNAMNVRIEDRTPDIETFIRELNADPPAKRIYGKIKKIDLYAWPLWVKVLLPVLGAAALAVGVLLLTGVIRIDRYSRNIVMPQNTVQVPDVEGLSSEEAISLIESGKLNAVAGGNAISEYIPAGHIVLQTPAAGTYVPVNSQVKVTVSAGSSVIPPFNGTATVPYLTWDTLADAKEKLTQAGLDTDLEVDEAYDDNVEEGKVISADKEAGTTLPEGSVLKLTVSKGPEPFPMPDVSGMKESEARKQLEERGLQVTAEYVNGSKEDIGKVIGQDKKKDVTLRKGDSVTITVSAATVPNVVGKTFSEAEKAMKAEGLSVSITTSSDGNKKTWGQVILQDPTAGTLPAESINLYVNMPQKGDIISFGNYWQSSDSKKEPIEWIVLDTDETKAFVISRYGLEAKPYNQTDASVTWENCTLRKWLNNDFFNSAFSNAEKQIIQTTTLNNAEDTDYGTIKGNTTNDKVFILSNNEARFYFDSDAARACYATLHARSKYHTWEDSRWGEWWIRSPDLGNIAEYVLDDGRTQYNAGYNVSLVLLIRPAMWIDLGLNAASSNSNVNSISTEARLSALNVTPGTWNRSFDPNVTEYRINVGADRDSLVFSYSTMANNCNVEWWPYSQPGKINVQKGTTNFSIKVTAQDGKTTKTYNLTIVRP